VDRKRFDAIVVSNRKGEEEGYGGEGMRIAGSLEREAYLVKREKELVLGV
jgi:hypothetical protein